ncbi:LxmA leader domain family RiPP [Streptomyces sp. NPDC014734]|uniref:LxmA leader domain family RiPP n=1 Tax=Streptomyces sp. NPDC014734 TaxID=3364886 RepID=UPI0036F9566F
MSSSDLMNGFAAYTDVDELAAEAVTEVADQESTITISITIATISVMHTYDTGC